MVQNEKRFIVDVMLGRLAKWLRIIGYDTLYFRKIEDSQLIRMAVREGRILLTRDIELFNRGGFQGLLIDSADLKTQLAQVIEEAELRPKIKTSVRCPRCNEGLKAVQREQIRGLVPKYVYATQREFSRCPRCERIFWRGTHWQRIERRLREMGIAFSLGDG
jgi:uncharacterized protein with PIN domain